MISITISFGENGTKQYDYLFINNNEYQLHKEYPAKLIVGYSYGVPNYRLIKLISCKRIEILPKHITAALTLVGDNIVQSSGIPKEYYQRQKSNTTKSKTHKALTVKQRTNQPQKSRKSSSLAKKPKATDAVIERRHISLLSTYERLIKIKYRVLNDPNMPRSVKQIIQTEIKQLQKEKTKYDI